MFPCAAVRLHTALCDLEIITLANQRRRPVARSGVCWKQLNSSHDLTSSPSSKAPQNLHLFPLIPHYTEEMAPSQIATNGIGIANLPNQRHKIVAKRGANFTLMVVGE